MARFYKDEHVPLRVTQHLRTLGHDVLTAQEAGNADQGIPDEDVVTYAIQQQRTVITILASLSPPTPVPNRQSDHPGVPVPPTAVADYLASSCLALLH